MSTVSRREFVKLSAAGFLSASGLVAATSEEKPPNHAIFFARCAGDLVREGTVQRVGTPEGFFTHPTMSPDGTSIAFWGIGQGTVDIWIADLKMGRVGNLTQENGVSCHPSWSADSRRIAYAHNPAKELPADATPWDEPLGKFGRRELWMIDIRTREKTQITRNGADNERPALSPDGRHLAYVSDRGRARNLWIIDLRTGEEKPVTDIDTTAYRPSWNPDGTRLAFNNKGRGDHALWLVDPDGRNLVRLTPESTSDGKFHHRGASWSADGREIRFHTNRFGGWGIGSIGTDGRNLRQIRIPEIPNPAHATWDAAERLMSFDATLR